MYAMQDGKLYSFIDDNNLVGVDVYTDRVVRIKGCVVERSADCKVLTRAEVDAKFNIQLEPYLFNGKAKVVEVVEAKIEDVEVKIEDVEVKKPTEKVVKKNDTNTTIKKPTKRTNAK